MTFILDKPTILIADDEPINVRVLAQNLTPNYRIKTATNGQKALAIVNSDDPPDLVLLDIQMPDMDGYQVLVAMRQQDSSKNIPVIFITAKDGAEDEAKGLDLGAMDYITKPFNLPVVNARVKNQIALKQKTDLLEKLALIDGLTEIPNRRHYDSRIEVEWRRAIKDGLPLSLVMIDIDEFKLFNDNYGHAQGDVALKRVAAITASQLKRNSDLVARYGGEEFVVLLPDCTLAFARTIADNIRQAVYSLNLEHEYAKAKQVTVSLGVSCIIPSREQSVESLQKKADELLYLAKKSGRNKVVAEPFN
ncbi:diguanylate cyclase [Catenovulum adriaticum]|uniref:diguanylate cyclase n=1 Tax=Catenovulum adriaticum TaxID=2984846 RepID=A0ABY7AN84_9ALTE|nr:diguanylate cyclase [Catenovulum sp. TS8]WAJ70770.1 diguanylate cyclase [Catenovulum sp. TS8]